MSIFGRNTVEKVRVNRLWNRKQDRTTSGAPAQSGVSGPLPAHQHTGTGTGGSTLQPVNLRLIAATELTIASDAITVTQSHHRIDTQADAANDDLATVNGLVANTWYLLRPENDARTVVLKHGTGNIKCLGNADITLDDVQDGVLAFSPDGTTLYVMTGGAGGVAGAHAILDGATHSDSLAGSVVAGDTIIGNATPKWSRRGIGTQTQRYVVDAGVPVWTHDVAYTTAARDALVSPATGFSIRDTTRGSFQRNVGTPATPVWMAHGEDLYASTLREGRVIWGSHRPGDALYIGGNVTGDGHVGIYGPVVPATSVPVTTFLVRTPSSSPARPSFFGRDLMTVEANDDQTGSNPNGYTNIHLYCLTPGTRGGFAVFNTVGDESFPDIGTSIAERMMYLSVHGRRETHQNHPAPGRSHISFYAPADSWGSALVTTLIPSGVSPVLMNATQLTMNVANRALLIGHRVYLITHPSKTPGTTVPHSNDEYVYIDTLTPGSGAGSVPIQRGTWGTRAATHGVSDAFDVLVETANLWLVERDSDSKFFEVTHGADSDPYSSPPSALRIFPRQADLDMGPQFLMFNRNADWFEPFFNRQDAAGFKAHETLGNVIATIGASSGAGLTLPTALCIFGGAGTHAALSAAAGIIHRNTTSRSFEMSGGLHLWPANPTDAWLTVNPVALLISGTHTLQLASGTAWVSFRSAPTVIYQVNASGFGGGAHFGAQPILQNAAGVTAFGPQYTFVSGPSYQSVVNATTVSVTHYGLYDAPAFSRTGTGTMTATAYTVRAAAFAIPAGITVSNRTGLWVENWTNAGTFTLQVGIDIDVLTGAATNFGIRNASNLVQTGYARFGGITAPTNVTDGDVTAQRAFVLGSARFGSATVPVNTVDVTGTLGVSSTIDMQTQVAAQQLWLYNFGNARYGFGVQAFEHRQFFPSDAFLTMGSISTGDGTTFTERWRLNNDGTLTHPGNYVSTPSAVQTIAAGTAILANAQVVQIQSTGNVTVTAAPTIANGADGQIIQIVNIDSADTITLQDQGTLASSNLRLMTTTVAISPRDSLWLRYNAAIGDWVQIAPLATVI